MYHSHLRLINASIKLSVPVTSSVHSTVDRTVRSSTVTSPCNPICILYDTCTTRLLYCSVFGLQYTYQLGSEFSHYKKDSTQNTQSCPVSIHSRHSLLSSVSTVSCYHDNILHYRLLLTPSARSGFTCINCIYINRIHHL